METINQPTQPAGSPIVLGQDESSDDFQPSIVNDRTEAPDYKEFVKLKTPKGFEIEMGSCCLTSAQLADICLSIYEHLKKDNGGETKESYLG